MTRRDDDIEWLARGVIDRTLPKEAWTHEAHFAVALWLLRHRPAFAAPDEMRRLISGYNEATGLPNSDTGGYHHTITLASLRAAADHLGRHGPGASLECVLADLMASAIGRSGWLLAYWRRETLFSVAARRGWVEPDILTLPF